MFKPYPKKYWMHFKLSHHIATPAKAFVMEDIGNKVLLVEGVRRHDVQHSNL